MRELIWLMTSLGEYGGIEDCPRFRKGQNAGVSVIYANPLIYGFPWSEPDTIANKDVLLTLENQPFRRYKGSENTLTRMLETLQD